MVDRNRVLNVRMTDAEMAMLQGLAEQTGLAQSDVVRQLIRRAHADAGLEPARPAKRTKRRS
jgi:hypothetical protein